MKKILMFALAAATLSTAKVNAQTEKGNIMIGGNLGGINYNKTGGTKVFTINVTPNIGWFVKDNLAVGGAVDIGYSKPKNQDGTFNLDLTPFARYYFMREGSNGIFGQAKAGIGLISYSGNSSSAFVWGLAAGYNHFFTKNVALEIALAFDQRNGSYNNNNVGLQAGLQIFLPRREARAMMNK